MPNYLEFKQKRLKLTKVAQRLAKRFREKGYDCPDAQSWAIRVVITGPWKLSVSVNPDVYSFKYGTGIETALIKNDKIEYIDDIGYDDVLGFENFEEVVEEIERLKPILEKIVSNDNDDKSNTSEEKVADE